MNTILTTKLTSFYQGNGIIVEEYNDKFVDIFQICNSYSNKHDNYELSSIIETFKDFNNKRVLTLIYVQKGLDITVRKDYEIKIKKGLSIPTPK